MNTKFFIWLAVICLCFRSVVLCEELDWVEGKLVFDPIDIRKTKSPFGFDLYVSDEIAIRERLGKEVEVTSYIVYDKDEIISLVSMFSAEDGIKFSVDMKNTSYSNNLYYDGEKCIILYYNKKSNLIRAISLVIDEKTVKILK
jgi:hypothetical protein